MGPAQAKQHAYEQHEQQRRPPEPVRPYPLHGDGILAEHAALVHEI
jgi:hypothetical protein